MRRSILLMTIVLSSAVAYAKPVYLDCTVSSNTEKKTFSIKLDQESGKITHTRENGSAFNSEGLFAATTITYQEIQVVSGIRGTYKYEIDRPSLNIREIFVPKPPDPDYAAEIPAKIIEMSGSCRIVKVKDRKALRALECGAADETEQ